MGGQIRAGPSRYGPAAVMMNGSILMAFDNSYVYRWPGGHYTAILYDWTMQSLVLPYRQIRSTFAQVVFRIGACFYGWRSIDAAKLSPRSFYYSTSLKCLLVLFPMFWKQVMKCCCSCCRRSIFYRRPAIRKYWPIQHLVRRPPRYCLFVDLCYL